ncbi:MAG TPA: hypothetical protein IAC98_01025 [Candidatus Cryptobacteroides pullicola]|nr:hypothetical protein [Candidatus Cryptobacteroides pullicola]
MDVELLSRIIRELIIDHDEVALPQVGTFVAEMVPASFSDRGYTVNPPYRRLSFVQRPGSDTLLVDFYAKANGMDLRMAESYLGDFLSELRKVLEERKVIVLPGLGRLRATRENALFFVPEEDLDIYPDGFGLKSVSLKHIPSEQEAVEIPVSFVNAVAGAGRHVSSAETVTVHEEEPSPDSGSASAETEPSGPLSGETACPVSAGLPSDADAAVAGEPEGNPESSGASDAVQATETGVGTGAGTGTGTESEVPAQPSSGRRKALKAVLIVLGTCVAVAGLLLAVFLILADVAPDFIDSILYTPEELRIINY